MQTCEVPWIERASRPGEVVAACAHCGDRVEGVLDPAEPVVFCCEGCRSIYGAIRGAGLGAFYSDRAVAAKPPWLVRPSARRGDRFEHLESHHQVHADNTVSAELTIEGVRCASCVWLLENLPRAVIGVIEARLDVGRSILQVRWDPGRTRLARIAQTVEAFGYSPNLAAPSPHQPNHAERALLMRLGVAGAIAGNVMLMAFALYSGADASFEPEYSALFRWTSLLLAVPSVFYCATPFFRGAWAAVRTRTPNMDVPIALGILVGFTSGAVNTLRGEGEIYFDTISALVFLLLVGRWLTARQHRRASVATDLAQALAPTTARLIDGEQRQQVRADSVQSGALVEVQPGERVPVDGRIEFGEAAIDTRLLTGESNPTEVAVGDRVYAGTENLSGSIRVRVEQSGQETRVGQLIRMMQEAQRERAPIVRAADRIAGTFVVLVLLLAGITLALWWPAGSALAVEHAVALLVVTCPCALGMATPLAVSVALSRAARRGILLKNGEVLEALARPTEILFDKSGTLTLGRPELVEWDGGAELGGRVSAAERGCDHPLARAFQRAFPAGERLTVEETQRSTGAGLAARIDGRELVVGTSAMLSARGIRISTARQQEVETKAAEGLTPVLVAEGGRVVAMAAFGDTLRDDAASSLEGLSALGYSLSILSGDHPLVVERVCRELPVSNCRGGVSPEQKLEEVRKRLRLGRNVVLVGDGMNDAAAMSAATVGFAVHGGAEASLLAASGFATEPGVAPVLEAVKGARSTLRVIHRSIGFSLIYNLIGVVLAMSGVLSPLLAAVLMPLSSLTVVTSALRSSAFQRPKRVESGAR